MLKERVVLGAAVVAACLLTPAAALAAPSIDLVRPADGERFVVGEVALASYTCTGNEPVTCTGSVPNGDPIDTSTPGAFTFTVNAADLDGATTVQHSYTVAPQACDPDSRTTGRDTPIVVDVACPSTTGTIAATDPANGTTAVTADREITYTPDAGFHGTDSFTYTVTEGGQTSDPATITVTVTPAACEALDLTLARNGVITEEPACQGDYAELAITGDSPDGEAVIDPETGGFRFTPDEDFVGPTSFRYAAVDADEAPVSPEYTVNVDVGPCADVAAETISVVPVQVTLDCLPEDGAIAIVDQPQHGELIEVSESVQRYATSDPAFSGTDTFTYKLDDGDPDPVVATATITVHPLPNNGGGNNGGGDPGGGAGGGGGGGGGGGLVPDEPDTPGPGLPPLPRLPSLEAGGPGSGNIPTSFGRQTGVDLRQKAVRANRKGRFALKFRNVNPFAVTGTLNVTGAFRKNGKGKRVPGLRVREPDLLLAGDKTSTIRLRLDRAGRRLLARKGRLKLVAELRIRDVEGERRTVTERFTLRAPKAPKAAKKG